MADPITLIGIGLGLLGTTISTVSQNQMVAEQTAASKRGENAREQQMQLDAQRKRRQSVREGIMARAMSLSVGVTQGAQYGSGVLSGMGGATAGAAENLQGTNSGEILGSRSFAANRDYFDATQRGQMGMSIGAGISSLGGAMVNNAGSINKLGQNWFGAKTKAPGGFGPAMPPSQRNLPFYGTGR